MSDVEHLDRLVAELTAAVMANSDEISRTVRDHDVVVGRVADLERRVDRLVGELTQLRRNVGGLGRGL